MVSKLKILKEFFTFLLERKKWWLIPVVVVLVLIGAVLIVAHGSALAPLIYTIF